MSTSTLPAGRIWVPEINLVRGFAILSVILIHVTSHFGRPDLSGTRSMTLIVLSNMVLDAFLHYAVPLFILISGLVLSLAYWRVGNHLEFYKKRFLSILPQYMIFSIVYIAFSAIVLGWAVSVPIVLGKLLTGTAWAHFWFIPLIFELYLLYPVFVWVYKYFEKRKRINLLLFSALAIQLFFSLGQVLTDTVAVGEDGASQLIFNSFPAYIFYFLVGIYIGRNIQVIKNRVKVARLSPFALIAISGGLVASLYFSTRYFASPPGLSMNLAYLFWSVAMPLITISMFVLFFRLASRPNFYSSRSGYFVGEMGTYAFGIYLIHPLFITVYELLLTHVLGIEMQTVLFYILLASLTIISSYAFVKVTARLPYGDWIISAKTRKQATQTSNASAGHRP